MILFYDRDGEPIMSMQRANDLFCDRDYRRVAETTIGAYWVSTVWLGVDHSFTDGPPVIFETMIFPTVEGAPEFTDIDCRRYCTEAEALAGHDEIVTLVRATTVDVDELLDEHERRDT